MQEIHVLWYRYSDGSSAGVVRAYADAERAQEDLDLLSISDGAKTFAIETVPVYYAAETK